MPNLLILGAAGAEGQSIRSRPHKKTAQADKERPLYRFPDEENILTPVAPPCLTQKRVISPQFAVHCSKQARAGRGTAVNRIVTGLPQGSLGTTPQPEGLWGTALLPRLTELRLRAPTPEPV